MLNWYNRSRQLQRSGQRNENKDRTSSQRLVEILLLMKDTLDITALKPGKTAQGMV